MQPEDANTLIEKGLALFELSMYEESLTYFDKAYPYNLMALAQ
jgi:hypothetical protein